MTIGTRVIHKRYSFLVGVIEDMYMSADKMYAAVRYPGSAGTTVERVEDLRATPVQP